MDFSETVTITGSALAIVSFIYMVLKNYFDKIDNRFDKVDAELSKLSVKLDAVKHDVDVLTGENNVIKYYAAQERSVIKKIK